MSATINKEWMNEKNRLGHAYVNGVDEFVEFIKRNNTQGLTTFPCPCVVCRNRIRVNLKDLRNHLIRKGIDTSYIMWALHGEKSSENLVKCSLVQVEEQNNDLENLIDTYYEMYKESHVLEDKESNSGELVTRKDLWLVAHERKDGTVLKVAKPKYDELKGVTKKRRQDSEGCSYSFSSINNNEVSGVFGKHRKGGIRAMGSHVTKNRVLQSGVGKAKHILCSDEEKAKQNEVIYEMSSQLTDLKALVMTILKKLPADFDNSSMSLEKATPTGEIGSTSTHGHMSVSRKSERKMM